MKHKKSVICFVHLSKYSAHAIYLRWEFVTLFIKSLSRLPCYYEGESNENLTYVLSRNLWNTNGTQQLHFSMWSPLPPDSHSSNNEYHCCQLTRQSRCVSNFYRTFEVFIWLSLIDILTFKCTKLRVRHALSMFFAGLKLCILVPLKKVKALHHNKQSITWTFVHIWKTHLDGKFLVERGDIPGEKRTYGSPRYQCCHMQKQFV